MTSRPIVRELCEWRNKGRSCLEVEFDFCWVLLLAVYYSSEEFLAHLESFLKSNIGWNRHLGSYEFADVSFSWDMSFGVFYLCVFFLGVGGGMGMVHHFKKCQSNIGNTNVSVFGITVSYSCSVMYKAGNLSSLYVVDRLYMH